MLVAPDIARTLLRHSDGQNRNRIIAKADFVYSLMRLGEPYELIEIPKPNMPSGQSR